MNSRQAETLNLNLWNETCMLSKYLHDENLKGRWCTVLQLFICRLLFSFMFVIVLDVAELDNK